MQFYLSSKYNSILSNRRKKRNIVVDTIAGPPYDLLFSREIKLFLDSNPIKNFLDSISTASKRILNKCCMATNNLKNEIMQLPSSPPPNKN
jgi:hypothetical protein